MLRMSRQGASLSFRTFLIGLGAMAMVLVLLGFLTFRQIATQSPLRVATQASGPQAPDAAMFVPAQAPWMVSLLGSPDELFALRQALVTPNQRRELRSQWQQLKRSLFSQTGLDYDRDLQPWLGQELTWALSDLDLDRDATNGRQSGYLVAIEAADSDKARECLELFWQRQALAGRPPIFTETSGVKILYAPTVGAAAKTSPQTTQSTRQNRKKAVQKPDWETLLTESLSRKPLATAVVGNRFILIANDLKVLQRSITNAQSPALNLAHRRDYQQALSTLPTPRLGLVYTQIPSLLDWLGLAVGQPLSLQSLETPRLETLTAALELSPQGIIVHTNLAPQAPSQWPPAPPSLDALSPLAQYVPIEAGLMATGRDLTQLWQSLNRQLDAYAVVPPQVEALRTFGQDQTGAKLIPLLKKLLVGNYALALIPDKGWLLVSEPPAQTKATLTALDRWAQSQGLTLSPLSIDNHSVTAWTRLQTTVQETPEGERATSVVTQVVALHTLITKTDAAPIEIFASSLDALNAALGANKRSIGQTPALKQAIAPLRAPNDGYFYLNWPQIRPWLAPQVPLLSLVESLGGSLLDPVDTLAVARYGSEPEQIQGDVAIAFGRHQP
jgi:Protein of unknown function (DUF3352)